MSLNDPPNPRKTVSGTSAREAEHCRCRASAVTIRAGASGRTKLVTVGSNLYSCFTQAEAVIRASAGSSAACRKPLSY